MGGAAGTDLRMEPVSRAAHRALKILVESTASAPLEDWCGLGLIDNHAERRPVQIRRISSSLHRTQR